MCPVPYPPGIAEPRVIDPIDPSETAPVTMDWSDWLTRVGESAVDESTWEISAGADKGDGVTPQTIGGKTVTPAAPSIVTLTLTTCVVYITTGVVGDTITVANHVRAGNFLAEKSATMLVAHH